MRDVNSIHPYDEWTSKRWWITLSDNCQRCWSRIEPCSPFLIRCCCSVRCVHRWAGATFPLRRQTARPTNKASATLLSIGEATTIAVQQGQQRSRCGWPDCAPEMAQASLWAKQARSYLQSPVEDRQQRCNLLSQDPWIPLWPHRGEVTGRQLELGEVEDGNGLCVSECSWAIATRRPISRCRIQRQPAAAMGVEGAWRITRPAGTSDAVEDHRDLLLIPDPVPGGRRYRCSEIAPLCPGPGTAAQGSPANLDGNGRWGSLRKSAPLR